jgi:hypothetical protein
VNSFGSQPVRPNRIRSIAEAFGLSVILLSSVIQIWSDSASADQPGSNPPTKKDSAELLVTGHVIDRETRQPIKSFRVVPGVLGAGLHVAWDFSASVRGLDGHYRISCKFDRVAYVLRIEAESYEPATSREFLRGDENPTSDFELSKGPGVDGIVAMPDGRPAAGAKVVVDTTGSVIRVVNNRIVNEATLFCVRESDRSGHFHLPPQPQGYWLVIMHESGYAIFEPVARSSRRRIITLDPWTRVEGTYRVNRTPMANVPLSILHAGYESCSACGLQILLKQRTVTGPEGRFAFEFVMSGPGAIWRRSPSRHDDENSDLISCCVPDFKIPIARTLPLDIEERGRPIIGTLRAPRGSKREPAWRDASIEVQQSGADERFAPYMKFGVKSDGSFRTPDLPLGTYRLHFQFGKAGTGRLAPRKVIVSTGDIQQSNTPRDLGVLTLESE